MTHDTYDPAQVTAFYIYAIGRTKLKAEQLVLNVDLSTWLRYRVSVNQRAICAGQMFKSCCPA